jgi:hypothetical protein
VTRGTASEVAHTEPGCATAGVGQGKETCEPWASHGDKMFLDLLPRIDDLFF